MRESWLKQILREFKQSLRRLHNMPRWGNLKRAEPFDAAHGATRGLPVDRRYMREFIELHEASIHGNILEIERSEWVDYIWRRGLHPDEHIDIFDINANNPKANIVIDICIDRVPTDTPYDCIIMMQTLQLLRDPVAALRNLWDCLAPGGIILVSSPVISRLGTLMGKDGSGDLWRFTPAGLKLLLEKSCPEAEVETRGYGSLTSSIGFLSGLCAHEAEFGFHSPHQLFPVVACGSLRKSIAQATQSG